MSIVEATHSVVPCHGSSSRLVHLANLICPLTSALHHWLWDSFTDSFTQSKADPCFLLWSCPVFSFTPTVLTNESVLSPTRMHDPKGRWALLRFALHPGHPALSRFSVNICGHSQKKTKCSVTDLSPIPHTLPWKVPSTPCVIPWKVSGILHI